MGPHQHSIKILSQRRNGKDRYPRNSVWNRESVSTDLYKVYEDSLLDRLCMASNATTIGPVICVTPACTDDCAVLADTPALLLSFLDIGVDSSKMERYILQPVKSVLLEIVNRLQGQQRI